MGVDDTNVQPGLKITDLEASYLNESSSSSPCPRNSYYFYFSGKISFCPLV
jgi:hypothetical protein